MLDKVIPLRYQMAFKHIFDTTSKFWQQTNYAERGYFSFWYDVASEPDNAIESFIKYLLTSQKLHDILGNDILGAEWWVHTRKSGRNFGHQLHFDTDENTMVAENKLIHPKVSSVFYLSTDEYSGNTIVFDINSNNISDKLKDPNSIGAFISRSIENTALFFPGDRLHGVLPKLDTNLASNKQRLTLMIGFWTTDLSKIGEREVFGAASKVPELTEENDFWNLLQYKELNKMSTDENCNTAVLNISPSSLSYVKSSWISLNSNTTNIKDNIFEVDEDIDRRYFFSDCDQFMNDLNIPQPLL